MKRSVILFPNTTLLYSLYTFSTWNKLKSPEKYEQIKNNLNNGETQQVITITLIQILTYTVLYSIHVLSFLLRNLNKMY